MDTSIFLAQVFSFYLLIVGVVIIVRRAYFHKMIIQLFDNKPLVFFAAIFTLILGILLVVAHPLFTPDWRSVITVLAYLTLLKGIFYMFVPEGFIAFRVKMLSNVPYYYVAGCICLILGGYLGWHGFYCRM